MCLDYNKINELPDNAMLKVKPELYYEWDFEKNNTLGFCIWKMTKGSHKKVWWVCRDCGSDYDASVGNRNINRGCPYCSGRKVNHTNSLESLNPSLSLEWDYKMNTKKPSEVTLSSNFKHWWICFKCESNYEARVCNRSKGNGCPYCSGKLNNHTNSLASVKPELASQWHPTKNSNLTPHDVACGIAKKVWWIGECGHEWEASINKRTNGKNCPYCAKYNRKVLKGFNDMWTTNPELASLLANHDDGHKYTENSGMKVDWKCHDCHSIIKSKRINQTKKQGLSCPNCSDGIKYPEKFMYSLLNNIGIEYDMQKTFNWSNGKKYDFYFELNNQSYIIETHGLQHYEGGFERARGNNLIKEQENDALKLKYALDNKIDNYIVIDCRESNFNYIKESVLNSDLSNIFNLQSVNWNEVMLSSEKSIIIESWGLYSQGFNYKDIMKELNIKQSTVFKYIRKGKELGIIS